MESKEWTPAEMQDIIQQYEAWAGKLASQGLLRGGHKLTDGDGKVLRGSPASVTVKDGPYIETKEVVGGYYLIKANDYAHAVKLCEGHPNFHFGSIEIRQLDFMGQPED